MRVFAFLVVLFAAAGGGTATDAPSYGDLLAKLKAGDTKIDYTALRYAYAETDDYDGYGGAPNDPRRAMIEAFNARDCDAALKQVNIILDAFYIDIDTHIVASTCHREKLDLGKSAFHGSVANGLEQSILASGDGKTPQTAFVVVLIDEEYYILRSKNLKLSRQSLVQHDGHAYDLMSATDKSGNKVDLYFQIDRIIGSLERQLKEP
jgi:hypothetical protein